MTKESVGFFDEHNVRLVPFAIQDADGTYKFYLSSNHPENPFTWSSSDVNVATVADDGTVTLVGAGTTTITATNFFILCLIIFVVPLFIPFVSVCVYAKLFDTRP